MTERIRILTPKVSLSLERAGVSVLTEEGVEILRAIHRSHSLSDAARSVGVSYAHAWNTINRLERMLRSRILETFRGGSSGGGGASLTSLGVQLLS
ncbi:MAG: winged helix-turn-helix domain-containing protein, partial [Candidatus Bathyarchaeia archaeon]